MTVRVRFAPSPTGYLHIGSARTALFNWLYARRHSGQFIIRVEDTDQTRSKPEFLKEILNGLRWLGLHWDEGPEVGGPYGPYAQSQRLERYRQAADQLLASGSAEREAGPQGEAIVFRVGKFLRAAPGDYTLSFADLLRGTITTALPQLLEHDIVLMKSDGLPTYNFACVVDDAAMAITHVIRGDDHISNTPKQVMLYQALKLTPPVFAHIPLIVDEERARLSKRKGATGISEFRELGYLPEGIFNYLALLGWAPGQNREIVSPQEIVKLFELERVKKTAAQFDEEKLNWVNTAYLRQRSVPELADLLSAWMAAHGMAPPTDRGWFERVVALFVKRLEVLGDIQEQAGYFFTEQVAYDPQAAEQFLQRPGLREDFVKLSERFKRLEPFTAETAETAARQLCAELGHPPKELFHPARVALTGRSVSPGLFEMIALFGKERTLQRLADAITYLEAPQRR